MSGCDKDADIGVRSAWVDQGEIANQKPRDQWRAKDMHNEGGRAFLFPGKVPGYEQVFPDVDRINPEYFKYLDRKIDYLNAQGFIPVIEVARRDMTSCWAKYYDWPESYSRYIEYVWSRYQANNCLFSPVHYDYPEMTAIGGPTQPGGQSRHRKIRATAVRHACLLQRVGLEPAEFRRDRNENQWLTFHQIGNLREHDAYWYLTEIFHTPPPRPALNGEPYYSGMADKRYPPYKYGAPGGTRRTETAMCARACTAVFFPAAWPATFTVRKGFGARTSSRGPIRSCGRRSNGIPPTRCNT